MKDLYLVAFPMPDYDIVMQSVFIDNNKLYLFFSYPIELYLASFIILWRYSTWTWWVSNHNRIAKNQEKAAFLYYSSTTQKIWALKYIVWNWEMPEMKDSFSIIKLGADMVYNLFLCPSFPLEVSSSLSLTTKWQKFYVAGSIQHFAHKIGIYPFLSLSIFVRCLYFS